MCGLKPFRDTIHVHVFGQRGSQPSPGIPMAIMHGSVGGRFLKMEINQSTSTSWVRTTFRFIQLSGLQ